MKRALALPALALLAASCRGLPAFLATPTPEPSPTRTVTPRPTRTPTLVPTFTPRPTRTPPPSTPFSLRPLSSPAPFTVLTSPFPSQTLMPGLDCRLDWQSPGNGLRVAPREKFSAGWKLTNTGSVIWAPGTVLFSYVGGAKLHNDPVVPLKFQVAPGQSVILTVDMKAPPNSTTYKTYWSLRQGDVFFCRVSVSIYVK